MINGWTLFMLNLIEVALSNRHIIDKIHFPIWLYGVLYWYPRWNELYLFFWSDLTLDGVCNISTWSHRKRHFLPNAIFGDRPIWNAYKSIKGMETLIYYIQTGLVEIAFELWCGIQIDALAMCQLLKLKKRFCVNCSRSVTKSPTQILNYSLSIHQVWLAIFGSNKARA